MMLRHGLRALGRRAFTLRRNERGSELIEFAVISILFFTLTFGVMEFGRAIWIYGTMAHVARQGARLAIVRGADSPRTATVAEVENYVTTSAAGMTDLVVNTTWDDPSRDPGTVVQVQVSKDFQPALPFVNLGPLTLTSTSRMVIAF